MHLLDGYLSAEICLATGVVAAGAVAYSLRRMQNDLADRTIPLTGMMGSLIFAGQMVNFPIGLPVSGHLMGGVLAAIVLGPWAGCIALSLVLLTQWALFSDGGLTVLGANVLHMGVIGSIGGYAVVSSIRSRFRDPVRGTLVGAVVASWLSVMAAASLFCGEFRLSHLAEDFDFGTVFALMVSFHSLIGLGEAAITGVVCSVIIQQRPDLIYGIYGSPSRANPGRFVGAGMVAALAVAAFLAPFASDFSDGLEAVAVRSGIEAAEPVLPGLLNDYDVVPSGDWQSLSVSLAGIGGSSVIFLAALFLGRTLAATGSGSRIQPES